MSFKNQPTLIKFNPQNVVHGRYFTFSKINKHPLDLNII